MSATLEEEAKIRRLYFAEHWPVGTVASQLHHHPEVVRRVLRLDARRPSPRRAPAAGGAVQGLHRPDAREVPDAAGDAAVRHGEAARLPRRGIAPHRAGAAVAVSPPRRWCPSPSTDGLRAL